MLGRHHLSHSISLCCIIKKKKILPTYLSLPLLNLNPKHYRSILSLCRMLLSGNTVSIPIRKVTYLLGSALFPSSPFYAPLFPPPPTSLRFFYSLPLPLVLPGVVVGVNWERKVVEEKWCGRRRVRVLASGENIEGRKPVVAKTLEKLRWEEQRNFDKEWIDSKTDKTAIIVCYWY